MAVAGEASTISWDAVARSGQKDDMYSSLNLGFRV